MPKLWILSGAEVCDILIANGFVIMRQRGSHVALRKRLETGHASVSVPKHDTLKLGALSGIIR